MEGEGVDFIHHSKNLKILEYSPSQSSTTYTSSQLLLFSHKKIEDLHLSLYNSSPLISTFSSFPLQPFIPSPCNLIFAVTLNLFVQVVKKEREGTREATLCWGSQQWLWFAPGNTFIPLKLISVWLFIIKIINLLYSSALQLI